MKPSRVSTVCARCAQVGKCCCLLTPGQEELCFPVSEQERSRIAEHGEGNHGQGHLVEAPNSPAFLDHMVRLFPKDAALLAVQFPAQGTHLRLGTDSTGACTYLTATGCCLPRAVRPYYCRLFPFWVSPGADGAVAAFEAKGCIAAQEGRSVSGMLTVLGTTSREVRDLHSSMRMAWGLPHQDCRSLVKKVPPIVDDNA